MRIDRGAHAHGFGPGRATPALAVAYEKALIGSESIDGLEALRFRIFFPRHVRENQAAKVGDVFAEGELTVDFDVVDNRVSGILVGDAGSALDEFFFVVGSPPLAQISLSIELATFIVEAMSEFVADGAAGIAVVRRGVR